MKKGFITPTLRFVESLVGDDDELCRLASGLTVPMIRFMTRGDVKPFEEICDELIAERLIEQGCVQVTERDGRQHFVGRAQRVYAAREVISELTSPFKAMSFEMV